MKPKTDSQRLIEKFCHLEKVNWPREAKIMKKLFLMEEVPFWDFVVLSWKLNSLAWFFTEDGKKEIRAQKKIFEALKTKEVKPLEENHEYVRRTESKPDIKKLIFE